MTSKYHTIGTPKQQSLIERLAMEKGYRDEVSAACEYLGGMSTSKLSKVGMSVAQASMLIDWLQAKDVPVDLDPVPTDELVAELRSRGFTVTAPEVVE